MDYILSCPFAAAVVLLYHVMSFHISKIHFDIFIHSYAPSIATGFPMHSIFL
jgi:hypothetical protein